MPIGYLPKDKQSFYLTDAFHIDTEGNIYFLFTIEPNIIQKFDQQLQPITTIDISNLVKGFRRDGTPFHYTGVVKGIFAIDQERLAISFNEDRVVIINIDGTVIDQYPKISSQQEQYARHFQQLEDGRVLLLTHKGFHGNVAAISAAINPFDSFPFPSKYLIDTLLFDNDTYAKVPLLDTSLRDKEHTMGNLLFQRRINYRHAQGTPFIHHASTHQIYQILEIDEKTLLALVMTNAKSKSNSPNKNMPYYLFLIDRATGQIKKEWSPDDRSVYKHNIRGRLVKLSDGRILLKTFNNIFVLDQHLEILSTISLEERSFSGLRKLSFLGIFADTIFLADHDKGYFVSYPFSENLEEDCKQLLKDLRKAKKEWKTKP